MIYHYCRCFCVMKVTSLAGALSGQRVSASFPRPSQNAVPSAVLLQRWRTLPFQPALSAPDSQGTFIPEPPCQFHAVHRRISSLWQGILFFPIFEVMKSGLEKYVEESIIPMYDGFDAGHGREHVKAVIEEALRLAGFYDVDSDMVYAAAAYHDTGLCVDRKTHHLESARIIRTDKRLGDWFTPDEIEVIAQAAEDHRASSDHEPRTIYGKIIAEADRQIIPESIILRTVQYGFKHYPELDKEGHWRRTCQHMAEKYDVGGYIKLWIPESGNAVGLSGLREIIHDKSRLRTYFETAYNNEVARIQGR